MLVAAEYPIVIDPVVNATPPGAKVSAGYLSLTNESDKTITITGAYSPDIAKVEIHLSSVVDDVAKMEKQDNISIAAGATVKFEHGGYHIMLMGLTEPLVENTSIDVILTTSSGDMLIEMPVKKIANATSKHGHTGASMGTEKKDAMAQEKTKPEHMNHSSAKDAKTSESEQDQMDSDTINKPAKVVH